MRLVSNPFALVIILGLYGVAASSILLEEYLYRFQQFQDAVSGACFSCGEVIEDSFLQHSVIIGVPSPILSVTLFAFITVLGVVGLGAGHHPIVNRASLVLVLISSAVGVVGGAYLLYVMLYILETPCYLCVSLDVASWTLTVYSVLRILRRS